MGLGRAGAAEPLARCYGAGAGHPASLTRRLRSGPATFFSQVLSRPGLRLPLPPPRLAGSTLQSSALGHAGLSLLGLRAPCVLRPQPQRDTGPPKGRRGNQVPAVLTSSELKVLHATESAPGLSRLFLRIITMVRASAAGLCPRVGTSHLPRGRLGQRHLPGDRCQQKQLPIGPPPPGGATAGNGQVRSTPWEDKKGRQRGQDGGRSGPGETCPLLHAGPASLLEDRFLGAPRRPDHLLGIPSEGP